MIIPIGDEIERRATPFQFATIAMLAICVTVWGWQFNLSREDFEGAFYSFGLVPAFLFGYRVPPPELAIIPAELTIITSMFMHGGWSHIIGNMIYLWVFGSSLEEAARNLGVPIDHSLDVDRRRKCIEIGEYVPPTTRCDQFADVVAATHSE